MSGGIALRVEAIQKLRGEAIKLGIALKLLGVENSVGESFQQKEHQE